MIAPLDFNFGDDDAEQRYIRAAQLAALQGNNSLSLAASLPSLSLPDVAPTKPRLRVIEGSKSKH